MRMCCCLKTAFANIIENYKTSKEQETRVMFGNQHRVSAQPRKEQPGIIYE